MIDFVALAAPFPRDAVHWRGQKLTFKKDKALALAYLDARDVMDRLDEIAGPGNWQDTYAETPRGRVVCTISVKCGDEWVAKSDGAGDTDVEGEKGGISDAFKRAAVKWGIGRYLYRMGQTWVPCELNEQGKFKAFADDPWKYVRNAPDRPQAERKPAPERQERPRPQPVQTAEPETPADILGEMEEIAAQFPGMSESMHMLVQQLRQCQTTQAYKSWEDKNLGVISKLDTPEVNALRAECGAQKERIRSMNQLAA